MKWARTVAENVRTMLGSPSQDPPLEVDTGLRPEGRNGPIVRTLASYAAYYEQWALPWEIQALLRAHQVAGDDDPASPSCTWPTGSVTPRVGCRARRSRRSAASRRVSTPKRPPRGADPMTHTKLGRGGLADIEWTVQLLQLKYAHRFPVLHNTSTSNRSTPSGRWNFSARTTSPSSRRRG